MALQDPLLIVALLEFDQGLPKLFNRGKGMHPQEILLEQANKAFDASVALGLSHEGGRRLDAEKIQFVLEVIRYIDRAMIVPHLQPHRPLRGIAAHVFPRGLAGSVRGLQSDGRVPRHGSRYIQRGSDRH